MEMSHAAIGTIAALCVTAGAAGVYVTTADTSSAAIAPVESGVTAATPDTATTVIQPAPAQRTLAAAPASHVARTEPAGTRPVEDEPDTTQQQTSPTTWSPTFADERRETEDIRVQQRADFVELTIPSESVIGLQIESALTSETAELEDQVVARVSRDVRVDDRVAIPSGARVHGVVTLVERGGRLRERARLGIRFTTAVLADGTRIPLATDTIIREGSSPGGESAAKIGGGAIGGAIIGGILGGARGAVIGGSVGAGAGTAAVMVGGRNPAAFPAGEPVNARLTESTSVTVDY